MTGNKKKIGIQLPRQANPEEIAIRYSLELEALEPVAEIIEVAAKTPEEFAAGVKHMDAIITSWGFRIDAQLIEQLENCVVIGVGSVGVDMVDIEAATRAGIVVTNGPDVFIEEVADHAMMMLLGCARQMKTMNRMAAQGDFHGIRALMDDRPHRIRVRTSDARELGSQLLTHGGVRGVSVTNQEELEVNTDDVERFRTQIAKVAKAADVRLLEVQPLDDDLESVFRYLVGR